MTPPPNISEQARDCANSIHEEIRTGGDRATSEIVQFYLDEERDRVRRETVEDFGNGQLSNMAYLEAFVAETVSKPKENDAVRKEILKIIEAVKKAMQPERSHEREAQIQPHDLSEVRAGPDNRAAHDEHSRWIASTGFYLCSLVRVFRSADLGKKFQVDGQAMKPPPKVQRLPRPWAGDGPFRQLDLRVLDNEGWLVCEAVSEQRAKMIVSALNSPTPQPSEQPSTEGRVMPDESRTRGARQTDQPRTGVNAEVGAAAATINSVDPFRQPPERPDQAELEAGARAIAKALLSLGGDDHHVTERDIYELVLRHLTPKETKG